MRLEGVWLRYHRRGPWVLRETDVRIDPGEVAVVLGRNGAGLSSRGAPGLRSVAGPVRAVRPQSLIHSVCRESAFPGPVAARCAASGVDHAAEAAGQ